MSSKLLGMTEDEARERILSAAEELYYRKGYAAVGMDELRAAAGVSLRRLYSLFPAKTDIVSAVLARRHAEWESGLSAAVAATGDDPRARLLRAHKASFQEYMAALVAETGAPAALAAQLSILAEGAQSTAAISADPQAAVHARRAAEVLIDAAFATV